MKRLSEQAGLDASDRMLAELLQAATRYELEPFVKERSFARLERALALRPANRWHKGVVLAVLLAAGSAAAAAGHRYVSESAKFGALAVVVPASLVGAAAQRLTAPSSAPPSSAPPSSAPPSSAAEFTLAPKQAASSTPHRAKRRIAQTAASEDATLVSDAIRALRTEHDPAHAQNLLDAYLRSHPRGLLSEEASALSIEAASALHNPSTTDLARRYLSSFPGGRYTALANRAVELATPPQL